MRLLARFLIGFVIGFTVAFAVVTVASGSPRTDPTPLTCDGKSAHFHLYRVERLALHAFDTKRFLDAHPATDEEKAKWRAHKFCLQTEEFRERAAKKVDRARAAFDEFFRANYTPYHFGEPTLQDVAIPPSIIYCETRGYYGATRWGAVNRSSGATGPYQMLPSTYAGVCGLCDWSHRDQHYAATQVYARSGGAEWACA